MSNNYNVFVESPFFKKNLSILLKKRYPKMRMLSKENLKKTKKCDIKKLKECNLILTHVDGSMNRKLKNVGNEVMSKRSKKNRGIEIVPTLVRRTFYDIANTIGNKSFLSKLMKNKKYVPQTFNLKCQNDIWRKELEEIFTKNKFGKNKPAILKPAAGEQQRGIGVCININNAIKHITNVLEEYPKYKEWEIQTYIYDPLLIKGAALFPGLKEDIMLELKDSGGLSRKIEGAKYYKCNLRAYVLLVYHKSTKKYSVYIYDRYIYNSSGAPYPNPNKLESIDFSDPWPHKSGAIKCGSSSMDFNDLIDYCSNSEEEIMKPNISPNDFTKIKAQVNKIVKDMIEVGIKKGNCCKPEIDSEDKALIIYHPIGVDLLLDQKLNVYFIEANPGVGFNLSISNNTTEIYEKKNIKKDLEMEQNFNSRLYNLIRDASYSSKLENEGIGKLSEKYFYIYEKIRRMDEKYSDISNLKEVLKNKNELNYFVSEFNKSNKIINVQLDKKDIIYLQEAKIPSDYMSNLNEDYIEYMRNCRYFWRHNFMDQILKLTTDKLVKTQYKYNYTKDKFRLIHKI